MRQDMVTKSTGIGNEAKKEKLKTSAGTGYETGRANASTDADDEKLKRWLMTRKKR